MLRFGWADVVPGPVPRDLRVRAGTLDPAMRLQTLSSSNNSVEAEIRASARFDVLILDDLALQAMDAAATSDFYELIVERHQQTSTIVTSNRDASEWIAVMSDPLLAQSAIDRPVSTGGHHRAEQWQVSAC